MRDKRKRKVRIYAVINILRNAETFMFIELS